MRPRSCRTWTLLAAAVVVLALGVGGGGHAASVRLRTSDPADVFRQPASVGTPDAVIRIETDRIESAVSRTVESASRLPLLFATSLSGLALLLLLTPRSLTRARRGPPSLARVCRWVGLRAPPSPLSVSLTP